eukprot:SAG11_NODE_3705_length_2268_cov_2.438451_2_plen_278_part_00
MSKITCWDFTLPFTEAGYCCEKHLGIHLLDICKGKSTFQLETSIDGYKHWQGRIITKKQYRETEIHKIGKEDYLKGIHWSITSNANKGNMDYCSKAFTRTAGPWECEVFNKVLTWQLNEFLKYGLWHWQQKVFDMCSIKDMRCINLIYDKKGHCGKSLFCEYLEYSNVAEEIPPFRLMDDIFQWVYSVAGKQAYIFDMPRGMKKDKLGDFYSGIEVIKNGVAYDKRYTAKKIRFGRPNIFVFTNTLPELSLMSKDRWKVWTINDDNELINYNHCQLD